LSFAQQKRTDTYSPIYVQSMQINGGIDIDDLKQLLHVDRLQACIPM
jgi:uncharacterized protein YwlG (UPF0340 family)